MTTNPVKILELETEALQAHAANESWATFWARIAPEVRRLAPYDRQRFAKLYSHLMHLCVTGDRSGEHPAGDDDLSPFERDDQTAQPADTGTQARLLDDQGNVVAAIVQRCQADGADVRLASEIGRPERKTT